jgi:hypothetical protein
LNNVLQFPDQTKLLQWLYDLPEKWSFSIEGSTIRFDDSIKDDIDEMIKKFDQWGKKGKLE